MLQNLRQIKIRIKSVESTKRIMRAMEMVSAAKLNRVKSAFYSALTYSGALESMFKHLLAEIPNPSHVLLQKKDTVRTLTLCVIASDTGLCGSYNHTILQYADAFLQKQEGRVCKIIVVGKEALKHYRKSAHITDSYVGLYGRYSAKIADDIAKNLIDKYTSGETDEVYIAYMHFSPSLRHKPVVEKFLNIEPDLSGQRHHYILEPDAEALLDRMLPEYVTDKMRSILLDAFTAEHSARMLAMKTATDNATDIVDTLTLMRNKARQFAITREVLEIAMSAEALKG